MTTEIEALMDLDPLSLSDRNLDDIIASHRKARANHEAGVKPTKATKSITPINLEALGLKPKAEAFKRRF